ncbi:mitochondrial translation release factor in rescue [Palaemon carinicauda]|uniref:mitochondrial translation release factor in rescue n=1 Tax=Palaemon carinicauda TaxID=392227 RepID=UPI0035B5C28D
MQSFRKLVHCRTLHSLQLSTRSTIRIGEYNLSITSDYLHQLPRTFLTNESTNSYFHTTAVPFDRKIDKSRVPVLDENDLEESFVRGSGPGGQSVNRTSSACYLKHIPTGFVVKNHETRSLQRNREKARQLMIEKLDQHYNGDMSVAAQMKRLKDEKANKADQKSKKKQLLKQMWREREGID